MRGLWGNPSKYLLLLILESLAFHESQAVTPWGLPVWGDQPTLQIQAAMEELAASTRTPSYRPEGSHSLHYFYLTLSSSGQEVPNFVSVGYMNDELFIWYDSKTHLAEARAPWMSALEAEYWERENQNQRAWENVQRAEIQSIMKSLNHSGESHSVQRMFGCEIQEDNSTSAFWQLGYDGEDHLTLNLDTLTWITANPLAQETKKWSDQEECYAQYNRAYLQGLCFTSLLRYLELGRGHLSRKVPPVVHVTRHLAHSGEPMLRCGAHGFYPRDIWLSWRRDGQELIQEIEYVESRPGGDGTYQSWVAVGVPPGEEHRYTCHVEHRGLERPLIVTWEPPFDPSPFFVGAVVVLALSIVAAVTWMRRKKRRKRPASGDPVGEGEGHERGAFLETSSTPAAPTQSTPGPPAC
ncbi:hereditary hemochromatosis protein homolog isoform X2 [Tachyglossus aculeatus]|uniref:hereditary hemochromatosis protein homolog isoform X2 n=1 Tax=Tachyglossus aculeatus TaxID=9261 RepID=UPI0018F393CB|nr:hereditary hemochromatosis protein homolog isoform X2 [Tachyglossus aculeatus]